MNQTVLVCDDAIFMRTMISDILSQAGFEVVGEAESGLQAVEKYRMLKPDLVTMDIVMPDMGGIEAVREICKNDPEAKILMCSAMGQQALVVEVAGRRYGIGVGQVIDFLEVPGHAVAERSDLPGIDPRLVKAVGVRDGQHFILLDIDALVAPIIGS